MKKNVSTWFFSPSFYLILSTDDGQTWSTPKILDSVNNNTWGWVGTGPPATLQMSTLSKVRLSLSH
jgi:hypothetical protein